MRAKQTAMAAGMAVALWGVEGRADPQGNVALTIGVAGRGSDSFWQETRGHVGARGDVILGRRGNRDWGWGPYGEVLTSFDDVSAGVGASGLLPAHPDLPFVVSCGGYVRNGPAAGWETGVTGQVFWGSRSYNYHGGYVMAGGVSLQGRYGLGESRERAAVIAAHIDGEVLALPFVVLINALRGSGSE